MLARGAVDDLRRSVSCRVLAPGDDGYDAARAVFNAGIDRRPAVIAQCASDDDVVRALAFARGHGLVVAVKCTLHNVAGFAVCDDGLVIDLSPMKTIDVDAAACTVRVGGGCTWGDAAMRCSRTGWPRPAGSSRSPASRA